MMKLVTEISAKLRERGETVSFAESCTGGQVSGAFVQCAGISDVYLGSVVAYAYEAKEKLLGVKSETLTKHGAVSFEVAREMASGARHAFSSTWSVSITGIAGPGGGTADKPVGTVCFSVIGPHIEEVDRQLFSGSRIEIQEKSVEHTLRFLLAFLDRI